VEVEQHVETGIGEHTRGSSDPVDVIAVDHVRLGHHRAEYRAETHRLSARILARRVRRSPLSAWDSQGTYAESAESVIALAPSCPSAPTFDTISTVD